MKRLSLDVLHRDRIGINAANQARNPRSPGKQRQHALLPGEHSAPIERTHGWVHSAHIFDEESSPARFDDDHCRLGGTPRMNHPSRQPLELNAARQGRRSTRGTSDHHDASTSFTPSNARATRTTAAVPTSLFNVTSAGSHRPGAASRGHGLGTKSGTARS